jgi:hypothetical protein
VLAAPGDRPLSLVRALSRGVGGYTWQLPVTTEPGRALGERWGYPKTVADIAIGESDGRRETTVAVDGRRVLTLTVRQPPTVAASLSAVSFTNGDGTVRREAVHVDGACGVAPGGARVEFEEPHPSTETLNVLGVGGRALAAVAFDGEFVIDPPTRLDGG